MNLHVMALGATVVGASAVIAYRLREVSRPLTLRKIVIPPLGMSTGFGMFLYPPTRIPFTWALGAFLLGAVLLALPLVYTSRLYQENGLVYVRRSRAFLWVLLGLIVLRLALRGVVEQQVTLLQTGSIFFVLAFGMIVRWRLTMLGEYQRLTKAP